MAKDAVIDELLEFLGERLGDNFQVVDHWDDDRAIGLARIDNPRVLAYVAVYSHADDLFVELEGPPAPGEDFPYSPLASHNSVDRTQLCEILREHLGLDD